MLCPFLIQMMYQKKMQMTQSYNAHFHLWTNHDVEDISNDFYEKIQSVQLFKKVIIQESKYPPRPHDVTDDFNPSEEGAWYELGGKCEFQIGRESTTWFARRTKERWLDSSEILQSDR